MWLSKPRRPPPKSQPRNRTRPHWNVKQQAIGAPSATDGLLYVMPMQTDSLGSRLRAAREARDLTLAQAEQATRIRAKFLEALERDDFSIATSETQARGFLRNYATFLQLDPDDLLTQYEAAQRKPALSVFSAPRATPRKVAPRITAPSRAVEPELPPEESPHAALVRPRRLHWFSPDVWFAVIVTLALLLLLSWAVVQLSPTLLATATPTLTPVVALGESPAAPSATLPPSIPATPEFPTPLPVYVGVNLSVRAEQRIWVAVTVDGVEQFAGLLAAGEVRDFVGQQTVAVSTGNGLGTRVVWNGRDQGTLGVLGEATVRVWTLEGIATLTPMPTATP